MYSKRGNWGEKNHDTKVTRVYFASRNLLMPSIDSLRISLEKGPDCLEGEGEMNDPKSGQDGQVSAIGKGNEAKPPTRSLPPGLAPSLVNTSWLMCFTGPARAGS